MLLLCFRRLNELRTISNPLAVGSSDRRVERLLRTINLRPALSPAVNATPAASAFLSKAGESNLPVFASFTGNPSRVDR